MGACFDGGRAGVGAHGAGAADGSRAESESRPAAPRATLLRCLCAELLKLRGSRMVAIHLAIALGVPLIFVAYYAVSEALGPAAKLAAFVQVIACGMTFVAGFIAGFAAEDEWSATHLQAVLGAPSRVRAAAAKLLVYLGLALACLALALCVFVVGMGLAGQPVWDATVGATVGGGVAAGADVVSGAGLGLLVAQFALIFLGSIPCYVLAFWVSLAFGRNAGFGVGILGLLVSLVLLTGLGDGIWPYVPWAWPERLAAMLPDALQIAGGALPGGLAGLEPQFAAAVSARYLGFYHFGLIACLMASAVLIVAAGIWVARTDGRRAE